MQLDSLYIRHWSIELQATVRNVMRNVERAR